MRPRVIRLHHKTVERLVRLRKEAESDGAYRVARRIHAVILNHNGMTSGEVAGVLSAPRSRVSEWLRSCELQGYEGLLEGCRPGRPAGLTDEELAALSDIVESGAVAYGYLSGVWTSPMIARVIEQVYHVQDNASYHKQADVRAWFRENRHWWRTWYLPPYSPELNAAERLWHHTRKTGTRDRYFVSVGELAETLTRAFRSMQRRPEQIRGYLAPFS